MTKNLDRPIMDRLKDAFKHNQLIILDDFRIAEWSPGQAAANRRGVPIHPTEIHIIATGANQEIIVIRLKSFSIVQEIIEALEDHKRTVYPESSREWDAGHRPAQDEGGR